MTVPPRITRRANFYEATRWQHDSRGPLLQNSLRKEPSRADGNEVVNGGGPSPAPIASGSIQAP